MDDRQLLLREILGARRDDTVRIAYADALGDDPRGELIKVQLALTGCSTRVGAGYASRSRERELLRAHGRAWATVAPLVEAYNFRRGFVEWIVTDARAFVDNAEALFEQEPILDVVLRKSKPVIAELAACPRLRGLRSLRLAVQDLDDDDVVTLVGSPHLDDLRWLDLSINRIGQRGFEAIAASIPTLQWVGLASNAAPDPTPQPMLEGERVHGHHITPFGERLRMTYPDREWLAGDGSICPDPWIY